MNRINNNRNHKPNKVLLLIAFLSALALMTVGCLQLPIEQRPVLNTLEPDHPASTTLPVSDYKGDESSEDGNEDSDDSSQDTEDPLNSDNQQDDETLPEDTDGDETTVIPDLDNEIISERPETVTTHVEIEGMQEEYTAQLFVSQLGYSLYFVPDRYMVFPAVRSEYADLPVDEIWPAMPVAELPDMFIRLAYLEGMNSVEASDYIAGLMQDDYLEISRPVTRAFGEEDYKTQYIHASNGDQWESELADIYIIEKSVDNNAVGSYIVISTYFAGAAEGHGSRFSQMLNTFYIER